MYLCWKQYIGICHFGLLLLWSKQLILFFKWQFFWLQQYLISCHIVYKATKNYLCLDWLTLGDVRSKGHRDRILVSQWESSWTPLNCALFDIGELLYHAPLAHPNYVRRYRGSNDAYCSYNMPGAQRNYLSPCATISFDKFGRALGSRATETKAYNQSLVENYQILMLFRRQYWNIFLVQGWQYNS